MGVPGVKCTIAAVFVGFLFLGLNNGRLFAVLFLGGGGRFSLFRCFREKCSLRVLPRGNVHPSQPRPDSLCPSSARDMVIIQAINQSIYQAFLFATVHVYGTYENTFLIGVEGP